MVGSPVLSIFDDYDIYLLAYCYPDLDLCQEIKHAETEASVQVILSGTPYIDDTFPWAEYAELCRKALNCRIATVGIVQSKEKLPSKLIDIDAIKAKNDIVDIIGQHTQLRKSGKNRFTGRCPLHNDKGPSLTVYADSQSWHCFGACNKGGDIFSFIMALNSCDFKQAVALLGAL